MDYSHVNDLTHPRFLAEPRTPERRERRAELLGRYLCTASRLFMDALVGPDALGFFRSENNPDALGRSSFEAMRHLFCNMTNAPTPVWVDGHDRVQPNALGEPVILVKPQPPA